MSDHHEQLPNPLTPSRQLEGYIDNLAAEQQEPGGQMVRYYYGSAEDTVTITPDEMASGYDIVWIANAKPSNKPLACNAPNGEINRGYLPRGEAFTTLRENLPPDYDHEAMATMYVDEVLPFCTAKPRGVLGRILFRKFGV